MANNPEHAPKTALQKKIQELQAENSEENAYTQEDFDRDLYMDQQGSVTMRPDDIVAGKLPFGGHWHPYIPFMIGGGQQPELGTGTNEIPTDD